MPRGPRALRGQVFYFDRNDATLPAGRWYVADLIGCEVRDADTGKVYGVAMQYDVLIIVSFFHS